MMTVCASPGRSSKIFLVLSPTAAASYARLTDRMWSFFTALSICSASASVMVRGAFFKASTASLFFLPKYGFRFATKMAPRPRPRPFRSVSLRWPDQIQSQSLHRSCSRQPQARIRLSCCRLLGSTGSRSLCFGRAFLGPANTNAAPHLKAREREGACTTSGLEPWHDASVERDVDAREQSAIVGGIQVRQRLPAVGPWTERRDRRYFKAIGQSRASVRERNTRSAHSHADCGGGAQDKEMIGSRAVPALRVRLYSAGLAR